jgi:hypothetical protein
VQESEPQKHPINIVELIVLSFIFTIPVAMGYWFVTLITGVEFRPGNIIGIYVVCTMSVPVYGMLLRSFRWCLQSKFRANGSIGVD